MTSDSKNIRLGIIISYVTLFISVIGNIIVTRKVLGYVGDFQYGLFSFVQSITTWLTVISNALGASFVRFATIEKNQTGDEKQTKTLYNRMFLIISTVAAVICFVLLMVLRINNVRLFGYEQNDSDILYVLFVFSIIQICITIGFSVYTLYINYKKRFIFSRGLALLLNITLYAGNWILAYFTRNILYVSMYAMIQACVSIIVQFVYVKFVLKARGFFHSKIVDKTLFRRILAFSSILIFGSVVSQISNQVDKTILGSIGQANDVTIYQLGQSFSAYVTVLSSSVAAVYIPTINELVVKNNDEELNRLFIKVSRFQMIIIAMVVFGFLSCGREFTIMWVGEERVTAFYVGAAWLLTLLCSETMNVSIEIQRARNKHLFRCICFFLLSAGNIGLSLLFIQLFGRENAIWACLLGSVITGILSNWIALNIYNFTKMKLPMGKYFLHLLFHVIFGGIAFAAAYFLFKIPSIKAAIDNTFVTFLIKGSVFVFIYAIEILIFDGRFLKQILLSKRHKKAKLNEKEKDNEGNSGNNDMEEPLDYKTADKKISFLINFRNIYYFDLFSKDLFVEVDDKKGLKNLTFKKVLRKMIKKHPNSRFWGAICNFFVPKMYNKQVINLLNGEKDICFFDSCAYADLLKYATSHHKGKVSIFAWNIIDQSMLDDFKKFIPAEKIFTYAKRDSDILNIEYIPEPLYVFEEYVTDPNNTDYKYDFYFLGRPKQREEMLISLFKKLHEAGFKVKADLFKDDQDYSAIEQYPFVNCLKAFIPYKEYVKNVSESKCLIEVSYDENPNITWRVFEGFAYKRKVMTNSDLCNTEPYYREQNYFICDFDNLDIEALKKFMKEPYDLATRKEEEWIHDVNKFLNTIYHKINAK